MALVALIALWFATAAGVNAIWAGSGLSFNEYGVAAALAEWAVFAIAIMLLGGGAARVPLSRAMADSAAIGLAYGLLVIGIGASVTALTGWPGNEHVLLRGTWYAAFYLAFGWMLVAFWRAGSRLWKEPPRLSGLRFLVAALLPVLLIPNQPIVYGSDTGWTRYDVWYLTRQAFVTPTGETDGGDTAYYRPDIDFEAVFYRQPALVNEALEGLHPSPRDRAQIYFVGVAPSSVQEVFRKEVLGAKAVFDERFGTNRRSIVLINSADTVAGTPLASNTNLGLVLDGIGRTMDPQKDVLVLFITTHGSKGWLSVSFPGFTLNELTPDRLSQALAKSGIRNKVLIISACYSGSFIPALAGSDTLIMTAAHADRSSFGCSNEREWTYFGDALFNRALTTTRSLPEAFAKARETIADWETEQGLTPSDPQISIGSSISRVLEGLVLEIADQRADAAIGAQR